MNVVFAGTPSFVIPSAELLHEKYGLSLVLSVPEKHVQGRSRPKKDLLLPQWAQEKGIPLWQVDSWKEGPYLEQLRAMNPDLIVVFAYGKIFPRVFIEAFSDRILNIHPSVLPRHRGPSPLQATLLAGDPVWGISIQKMVFEMDQGPLVAVFQEALKGDETAGVLFERCRQKAPWVLLEGLKNWQEKYSWPQDEEGVSYCHLIHKKDSFLDPNEPADVLERKVRAYHPGPLARFLLRGEELLVHQASCSSQDSLSQVGSFLGLSHGALEVATIEGVLRLHQVQWASRKILHAEDFYRGSRLKIGELFSSSISEDIH